MSVPIRPYGPAVTYGSGEVYAPSVEGVRTILVNNPNTNAATFNGITIQSQDSLSLNLFPGEHWQGTFSIVTIGTDELEISEFGQ